jgi:hypothetical protein
MELLKQDLEELDDEERLMVLVYIWFLQDKREGGVSVSILKVLRGWWASLYYVCYLNYAQSQTLLLSPSSALASDI